MSAPGTRPYAPVRTKEYVQFVSTWVQPTGDLGPVFREQLGEMVDAETAMALELAGKDVLKAAQQLADKARRQGKALDDLFAQVEAYLLVDAPASTEASALLIRINRARDVLGLKKGNT